MRNFLISIVLIISAHGVFGFKSIRRFRSKPYEPFRKYSNSRTPHDDAYKKLKPLCAASLIASTDKWSLWAIAASSAAFGLRAEKTAVGRSLSGPVCAMVFTAILTNLGILPSGGSEYITGLLTFVVKLATPLLLLGADIRKIIKETGVLFKAFLLGTLGTSLGSVLSFFLFYNHLNLGADGWKVAGALTAKNIGGGLNFMQVASALSISPVAFGIAYSVDNVLGLIYFPLISYLGRESNETDTKPTKIIEPTVGSESIVDEAYSTESMTTALALACTITAVAEALERHFGLVSSTTATLITTIIATLFPKQLATLIPPGDLLGRVLLMLFFGAVGMSSGTIAAALASPATLALFGYGLVLYVVHLVVVLCGGKLLKIPLPDILVASNANIGNAATATAFAASRGWRSRVLPALLVGTFGNAIGTFLGLSLSLYLFKPLCN